MRGLLNKLFDFQRFENNSRLYEHPAEGKRWCPDCKYCHGFIKLECTYHTR